MKTDTIIEKIILFIRHYDFYVFAAKIIKKVGIGKWEGSLKKLI